MAEAVVTYVIEGLGDLLINKVVFLKGVRGQVERLKEELVSIRCFLKDADQKQDEDERIRNWVYELKDVGYDAEDVIELFISKIESIEKKGRLKKLAYWPKRMLCLNKVGKDIESIQSKIGDIAGRREKYGIKNLGEGTRIHAEEMQRLRRSYAFIEDKDTLGLEDKTKSLVAQLLKEDNRRRVFSITGMGGVGKTTLARSVYNHAGVQTRFDCRAWVYVSVSCNFRDILMTIIKQVKSFTDKLSKNLEKKTEGYMEKMLEKKTEGDMEKMLHEHLQDKCYLVVLDDVWKEKDWDCLNRVFPDGSKGGRLLLTSRYESVALHADALSTPYQLKPLEEKESWLLFLKKAFRDSPNASCPSDLEDIARKIAIKCAGLPLAITIIGSLLLGKKRLKSEWEIVLNDISTYLSRGQNGVSAILELSYRDLPFNLKFCFCYLGMFPEKYEIRMQKLMHLWVAEGIIPKSEAKCLEDIAADYMEQLLDRNMVQAAEIAVDDRVKSYRIHDLLRELATKKAKDEIFLQICGRPDGKTSVKSRYLAVHLHTEESLKFSAYSTPHLRSLLFFNLGNNIAVDRHSFKSLRLLRVLDLEDTRIRKLPKEIGEINLLSYLGLRYTHIEKLPHSLGRLEGLQTLDVFNDRQVKIPNVIWKLDNLRHLYVYRISSTVPFKLEGLRSLRTLSRVHADDVMRNNLINLTCLQKLGIWLEANSDIEKLCASLRELWSLKSLNLYADDEFPSLAGLSKLSHRCELKISGKLKMLPPQLPLNLSRLSLTSTWLAEDPMPTLEKLGRLSFLKLKRAYSGKKITISRNGFHQLKFLELQKMNSLQEVKVEKGALPELRCLRIRGCGELEMLPEELMSMTALEKLELVNMPESFLNTLEGPDSYKVCKVPIVRIFNIVDRVRHFAFGALLDFVDRKEADIKQMIKRKAALLKPEATARERVGTPLNN